MAIPAMTARIVVKDQTMEEDEAALVGELDGAPAAPEEPLGLPEAAALIVAPATLG